jgi:two-component system NarL family sensor kinase
VSGKLAKVIDRSDYYATYYSNVGAVYSATDPGQAIEYYRKALQYIRDAEDAESHISLLNSLAHSYIDLGKVDSARIYINEAIVLLDRYPRSYNYDRFHTWDNLGHIYMMEGNFAAAEQLLSTTFAQAQNIRLIDIMMHMEPNLAHVYACRGKYQQAYEHMRHYALLKDTILEEQKTKSIDLWIQSRLAEKDKIVLAQQLRISKQQNQIEVKNLWIGGSVLGVGLLLATLIAIARSYQHKQKLQSSALKQMQQEQEINQLKALVRGEEQERNRIAIELHDGIASELWGIKLNVGSLREQERNGDFKEGRWEAVYSQLDHTAQKVRTTAHNLMPDLLLDEGLAPALATLCHRMKSQTGLEVDFQEYGSIGRMNEEIELSVYRMTQELIQNALKHATGATQLLVQLSCTERLLNITVEDNGAGFAEKDLLQFSGFGLGNIKKRVASLQGHFELKSQPGEGTTAYLEFDIQHLL